jgi:hypothetical protein
MSMRNQCKPFWHEPFWAVLLNGAARVALGLSEPVRCSILQPTGRWICAAYADTSPEALLTKCSACSLACSQPGGPRAITPQTSRAQAQVSVSTGLTQQS